mgnify:FL=1
MNAIGLALMLMLLFALPSDTTMFVRTLGGVENDYAACIQQTADGGYIIVGQTDSFGNGSRRNADAWIINLDSLGITRWEKTFGEAEKRDGALSVDKTTDGGFIVAGAMIPYGTDYPSIWIAKFDADGDSLWTRILKGSIVSSANAIRQTIDGGYILAGRGEENLLKLDSRGNREWGLRFGRSLFSVDQTPDGGFVAAGDSTYQQLEWDYIPALSLIKVDDRGDMEWSNPLGDAFIGSANCIRQTDDGGYILAGDSIHLISDFEHTHSFMVMKLGADGGREWQYYYDTFSNGASVEQTADGGYIAAGNMVDADHGLDFLLVRLDGEGNLQWTKTYGRDGGWEYASAIRQTADRGFIVAGQTDSEGAGRYDMWIMKLDANGNGPGPVGIAERDFNALDGFSLSQSYPNPTLKAASFRFTLPRSYFVTLAIYDMLGKKCATVLQEQRPAGDSVTEWPVNELPAGLYFYRLEAGPFTRTRKFIVR